MELIHTLYEPAGKGPHPTILTLHGRGANALDLLGLAPHISAAVAFLSSVPKVRWKHRSDPKRPVTRGIP